jgi:hypothetical protein
MIDVAIKYFILDQCIDALFDRIYENFNLVEHHIPCIGDVYRKITHNLHNETYYNCNVVSVEKINNTRDGYIVYITYEHVETEFGDDDDEEMSDAEAREYVRDITGKILSDEEADSLIEEGILDDVDFNDEIDDDFDFDEDEITDNVDLVETDEYNQVGLSTLFFTFHK